ncbi:MAG: aminotransferase class I/II-fold pyridoxal phosphate-dependent enzyme [Planctomycetes bacterium]|nr:aminotransferase class I/II-fold pyridoxal phosphate-dependent enzyme [Planctomycetota bacterium]
MQLMVLAAGMGRRLREVTADKPKCMIRVNGRTLIERSLDTAAGMGFDRFVVVVGYRQEMIRECLGDSRGGVPITYVENPIYDSTNNIYSLYLARERLVEDDTVLMESDLIYQESILQDALANRHPNLVVVDRYKPHMDGTVIKIGGNNEVTAFISKSHFDYRERDSYFKTVNIYKFSREFSRNTYVPFLESYCRALGHNKYYEQVLRVILTLDQKNLKAMPLRGEKWYEIDSLPDLRNAELMFADGPAEKLELFNRRYGGYWRAESVRDFCYLVNPYFPSPRMVEEIKDSFVPLMANYPSGQATQCLLAAEMLACREEYLAVGNGAAELIQAALPQCACRVGVIIPAFNEYLSRTRPEDLVICTPRKRDYRYDRADLIGWLDGVDALVLVNPDNPSGNYIGFADLIQVLTAARLRHKTVILDESFVDFAGDGDGKSCIDSRLLGEFPNLLVIKSVSKSYGVPGLRLGVAASADRDLIEAIRRAVAIWNINSFGEFFLQIMPKYRAEYREACRQVAAARSRFAADLAAVPGLRPLPSQANFILCRLPAGVSSSRLAADILYHDDLYVKDCAGKTGMKRGGHLRLSVRTPRENRELAAALARRLASGARPGARQGRARTAKGG